MQRRTMYEADTDRAVQTIVQRFLQSESSIAIPGSVVSQTPPRSPVDFCWHVGSRLIHVAELKRRNCRHDRWPDYMISLSKVEAVMQYVELGWILVLYTDGLYRIPVRRGMSVEQRHGGRTTQVRDQWDQRGEPCAIFPISDLMPFRGWSKDWDAKIAEAVGKHKRPAG